MLREIKDIRQDEREGLQRWFTDDEFDLFVWYRGNNISRFQLCYDKEHYPRALTWDRRFGFTHDGVDDGELTGHHKMSPILVKDGKFDKNPVLDGFRKAAIHIDQNTVDFVIQKISEHFQNN